MSSISNINETFFGEAMLIEAAAGGMSLINDTFFGATLAVEAPAITTGGNWFLLQMRNQLAYCN